MRFGASGRVGYDALPLPLPGVRTANRAPRHLPLQRARAGRSQSEFLAPREVHAAFDEENISAGAVASLSPREFGTQCSLWSLDEAAEVSFEEGLTNEQVNLGCGSGYCRRVLRLFPVRSCWEFSLARGARRIRRLRLLGRSSPRVTTSSDCTASPYKPENTITLGVRFSTLLTEGGDRKVQFHRA